MGSQGVTTSLKVTARDCGVCVSWGFSWPSLAGREVLIRTGSVLGSTSEPCVLIVPAKHLLDPLFRIDRMGIALVADRTALDRRLHAASDVLCEIQLNDINAWVRYELPCMERIRWLRLCEYPGV